MALRRDTPPPIAIVGIGLKLPGGISTPEDFWSLLVNKKDGRCRVPSDRYNVEAFYGDKLHRQSVASDHGYFLQDTNLKSFDAAFFSMNRSEVENLDPQQRLLLEVIWECMERAGQTNWRGTNTGCYVGVFGEDWHDLMSKDTQASSLHCINGSGDFSLSNRVSYEYNLRGPSLTIRTACSSSLIGLHEACQALYNGECPGAIVAGTSLIISPSMTMAMTQQGVLSPTGSCKTFDAAADGFARGEAVNAVYIKLLDDAILNNDPIRAVIRSTAINSDGKTAVITAPSAESQEIMIQRAYEVAGIGDMSQTPYFECHGTGTQVGDTTETTAVANVFGERETYIGSVKPNVGHSEGASGLTSVIKAVLALENEMIPPNINFSKPNPKIPFQKGKLHVPVEAIPWPRDRHARISINSFGIGGANAHAIIDSAVSFGISPPNIKVINKGNLNGHPSGGSDEPSNETSKVISNGSSKGDSTPWPHLLPLSANSSESLRMRVQDLCHYHGSRLDSLGCIASTLGTRRDHMPHRAFCIAKSGDEILEFESFQKTPASAVEAVFVFTGQGAQWARMGKDLIQSSQSFRDDIQEMDQVLQSLAKPPSWTIEATLCFVNDEDLINKAEFSQPLCTAIQIALVNFLARCGVTPRAIVGHSSGEIAGAYASGAITAAEAILVSYYRGLVTKHITRKGSMAAVGLGQDSVLTYLADGVTVACINSPKSTTLSGDEDGLEQTLEAIKAEEPSVFTRRLRVKIAYHSYHMHEVGDLYEDMLKPHLFSIAATVPFYSSVTGHRVTADTLFGPDYWRSNLESPVLFNNAVQALLDDLQQKAIFLEIGPHSALQGPINQISQEHSKTAAMYIPTLIRGDDSCTSVLRVAGQLYVHGYAVDFSFINPPTHTLTDLPNYPWDHRLEFWDENRISKGWRHRKHRNHELLGSLCLDINNTEPVWRNLLNLFDVLWLKDHKIMEDIVFPCAGYIAMIGEAIRQMTGSETYALRNLVVKTAMVLLESETVEIITAMRPSRLTDNANSSWYEFSISSFNGTSWAQHCVAEGRAGQENSPPTKIITPYPRQLSREFWYERLQHLGLNYGPSFQGMREISAHTSETVATASIWDDESEHMSKYSVHPTTIDLCLQLFTVAMTCGVARRLEALAVPTKVGYVFVRPGGPSLVVEAAARVNTNGFIKGDVMALGEGNEVVIRLDDGKFTPLAVGDQHDDILDSVAATRLVWRPDIDFLAPGDLMHPVSSMRETLSLIEKACALYLLRTVETLEFLDISPGYLVKFASWLKQEKDGMARGDWNCLVPEAQKYTLLDTESRDALCDSVGKELEAVSNQYASNFKRLFISISESSQVRDIFMGKINPLHVLTQDGGLTALYNVYRGIVNYDEFFSLCAHAQPTLKVLEVGAGTGGTTEDVLKALISKEGTPMYSQYTFTDISSGFFAAAKERFRGYTGLSFKTLDISMDPAEQGFDLGTYDLIVASNVLHATPSLNESLRNVRSLLRLGGRLFLQELVQPLEWRFISFIAGFVPGWWLGGDDNRSNGPLVPIKRWDCELREAGFSGTNAAILDDEFPYHLNANIVATAIEPISYSKDIIFLYKEKKHEFACDLACRFEKGNIKVHWSKISDQEHFPGQDIVSTVDLEGPYFHDIPAANYEIFMEYVSKLRAGMLWITRPAQVHCVDPRYGLVVGLARTLRSELSLDVSTLELQSLDSATVDAAFVVFQKFQRRSMSPDYEVEPEFAVHDGIIHIGRYHWISASKELESVTNEEEDDDDPKCLTIGQYGLIDSLLWVQYESVVLQANEVEMDIRCIGLNFRDVLVAMGIVEGPKDKIGNEASGVIVRVGTAVKHVKVGDRVIAMDNGCFATRKVLLDQLVVSIPEDLSFEDAATLPTVFATVIHSIVNVGQLAKGESILIQSACGGVGLAALQICKMLEAEIYVTVGNEEKVKYLMDNYGLPRERIFNSRNDSFLYNVLQATGGRGVDMVLNSLSGELLHASWQCVAKYGRMLEIGKRDFIGRGQLALDPFEKNRAFYGIDLAGLTQDRPREIRKLMEQCMQYYNQGYLKPIRPIQVFPAQRVAEAFHYMQKGQHMGKILVQVPQETKQVSAVKAHQQVALLDKSTYFLVGGMGGLGKALTTWMVERGARSFIFLSRSAGKSSEDQAFIRELESQDCRVVAVTGSVVELADVKRAVQAAPTPIAGVVQMSMVLRDLPILRMSYDDWSTVQDPKVKGTWNLHESLSGVELDFFILFSSQSAVCGQPGQANYASANTFLDSFVQYRQSLNLPCSVIDVGVMDGVGYVSRNGAILRHFRDIGAQFLQEQDLMDAIQISIAKSLPPETLTRPGGGYSSLSQVAIGMRSSKPLSDSTNRTVWKRDIRMSLYRQLESTEALGADSNDGGLRALLNMATNNPEVLHDPASLELVTAVIGRTLCGFTLQPEEDLDITTPLAAMGVDSLVSIEIRNWWRRTLGVDISVLDVASGGTIERLGKMAIASLLEKHLVKQPIENSPSEVVRKEPSQIDLVAEFSSYMDAPWDLQGFLACPANVLPHQATIFLTGASGYLGTEILRQLIHQDTVRRVVVLVRAQSVVHGKDRIRETARIAGWWSSGDEAKVEIWLGDLAGSHLGLDDEQLARLCGESSSENNIDAIIHNGAVVNFNADYETLRAPNVESTVELLRLAASSSIFPKFIYVSGGMKMNREQPFEVFAPELSNHIGYSQTKIMSESIVHELALKLPAGQNRISVVKPGFIIGTADSGISNIDDALWHIVATAAAMKVFPEDPVGSWLYVAGVDAIAARITNQLFDAESITVFVDVLDGMLVSKFWELVSEELSLACSSVPWDDWVQLATVQMNEIGDQHPMWTVQHILEYRPPPAIRPLGAEDCLQTHSALRSSIRYLVRIGFIRLFLYEGNRVLEGTIGRTHK